MGNTCATLRTTIEMLDAIEAGISALRTGGEGPPREDLQAAVVALHDELRAAGLSAGEFARLARVPAIRMISLLTPSARRKLLQATPTAPAPSRTDCHPFSKIEEL